MKNFLLFIGFIVFQEKSIMAAPKIPLANECSNRMKSELPEYFTGVVAHGSHSLTQQDVQFYFPNEKEEITFPVVNPNLQSETEILSKPVEFKHSFNSPSLRAIDQVLSHIDEPNYSLKDDFSSLGKIIHAAHMQDWWSEARRAYAELKESEAGIDEGLCTCIKDVDNNGIVDNIKAIAHQIRGTGLGNEEDRYDCFSYSFSYSKFSFKSIGMPKQCLAAPKIVNGEAWKKWKNMLLADKSEMREYGKQLALYMHCMLQ